MAETSTRGAPGAAEHDRHQPTSVALCGQPAGVAHRCIGNPNMQAPDGYTLKKALRSTLQSEVYLASRLADGQDVILKAYRGDTREGHAQRELEALRASEGAGIPRALDLVLGSGAPALVLERVPGIPLIAWLESGPPPVSAF